MAIAELPPRVGAPATDVARAVDRSRRWTLTLEQCAYLALFGLALLVHLYGLGDGALHHDETHHANYSWLLFMGRGYIHDPLLHGPFLYHLGALIFFLFGDNDYTARLGPALFGSALVVMPYLIRREFGRGAALLASVYLLISPAYLYWGRHIRHDMYAVTFELLAFISIVRYASTRQARWLYIGAAALGLMFTTMETFFLYLVIFGSLLALVFLWRVWRPGIVSAAALGLAIVALVFVLPGKPLPATSGGETVPRALGAYVCPTPTNPFPPDNPIASIPGPILGLGSLATADNNYALCVRNQPDDDFGVYFIKLGQFFGHPAILLALAVSVVGLGAIYLLIWRKRDRDGTTAWQRARAESDGLLEAFASLATGRRVAVALAIFVTIYTLFFTAFMIHPSGIITGTTGSLLYWLGQHGVARGSQPGYYYLILLGLYEPLVVIWGIIGVIMVGAMVGRRLLRGRLSGESTHGVAIQRVDWSFALPIMLAWWSIATLALYSWAGEKMPWLIIHVALPFVLLGSWALARTLRWWRGATMLPAPPYAVDGGSGAEYEQPTHDWAPASAPTSSGNGHGSMVRLETSMPAGPLLVYLGIFAVVALFCFQLLTIVGKPGGAQQSYTPLVPLLGAVLIGFLTLGAGLIRGARWAIGALAIGVTLLGGVYSLRSAYQLNYRWSDVAREKIIFVQTAPDVARVIDRLEKASMRRGGGLDMPIWYDNETVWYWYLRRFTNKQQQPPALPTPPGPDVQAVLMLRDNITANPQSLQNLQGFRLQRYPLRWWFPNESNRLPSDWATAPLDDNSPLLMRLLREPLDGYTAAQLWQYLIYRQPPQPLGSVDFVIAVRPELADDIGLGVGGGDDAKEP